VTSAPFLIRPIPAGHLHQVRDAGHDASGNPVETISDMAGEPLRCCLRNSRPGESDARGWIHPATTMHDGGDPEDALRKVLSTAGVVEVHSRNIAYGCFMFAATSA
jgi:hypothetical protein